MHSVKMKKAFSMVAALFIIVIMTAVAAFVMNLSGKIVKSTTAQYQHEQAELYAKSYTEYAIMAVTAHDRGTNCVEQIAGTIGTPSTTGNGYLVRVYLSYIGPSSVIGTCPLVRQLDTNVITTSTPLTIIVDAYVKYKDPDNLAGPWMTVHRRTIQKI